MAKFSLRKRKPLCFLFTSENQQYPAEHGYRRQSKAQSHRRSQKQHTAKSSDNRSAQLNNRGRGRGQCGQYCIPQGIADYDARASKARA
jgi:hypothetical protein